MFTSIGFFFVVFIVSLVVLLKASDWFVNASEKIGLSFGVAPFIIGVTIVAFGTSLPELATSISAVISGSSEIVIGNVVGSNIANILLVLGLSALIGKKILMDRDVMESEMPQLLGSALFIWFVVQDLRISLIESILFLVATVAFMANFFTVQVPMKEGEIRIPAKVQDYLMLIGGGALVYFSSNYAIVAVQEISVKAGIDTEFLALSLVAIGTSLPEVFVSVTAARKGKHGIAIGNVLGSNIFNTYLVTAISSFFGVLVIPEHMTQFAVPFMVAMTFLFALVALRLRVGRWEGLMLLVLFAFYIVELGKAATTTG